MKQYTIYCTEEQTHKALELGAPILAFKNAFGSKEIPYFTVRENNEWTLYVCPTTEQMLGWLEGQKAIHNIEIIYYEDNYGKGWFYCIFNEDRCNVGFNRDYPSRKEATLAAIDAALEYLSNK